MKIQLSKSQLEGLHLLVTKSLELLEPESIPDRVIWQLMDKLNERLRDKVRKLRTEQRIELKMTLSELEACAFWMFFRVIYIEMKVSYYYEILVAERIASEIDQEYA